MFVVVVVLGSKSHLSLLGSQQIISKTLFKVKVLRKAGYALLSH